MVTLLSNAEYSDITDREEGAKKGGLLCDLGGFFFAISAVKSS